MSEQSDSLNTTTVIADDRTIPHTPLGPIPPKLKELLERERELLRRYGKLPPAGEAPQPPAPGQA